MSHPETDKKTGIIQDIPFLAAIFRGVAALCLGLLLLFMPNKSFPLLANLMGGFWVSSGLLLLHKDADKALRMLGKRTSRIMGLVAILTGLLVITRPFTEHWLGHGLLMQLLGVVIFLTGVLHMWGEVRIVRFRRGRRTLGHFILGVFEVILGVVLFISPLSTGPLVYLAALVWALVGGVTIIGSAIFDFREERKTDKVVAEVD